MSLLHRRLAASLLLLFTACAHVTSSPRSSTHGRRPLANGAYEQLRREWQDENGVIPGDAFARAQEQIRRMRALSDVTTLVAGISRNSWSWLGPGNIGGRIAAIYISPSGTMFAASTGGGLWKSTNSGATWQPVDDFIANLSITSIAADPTNASILYAATGEGFGNGGAIRGAGVFKSIDGGSVWSQLSSTATDDWYSVNWLTISPDGKTILAATTGQVNAGGIWRSADAGATWTKTADGADVGVVEFHPTDPNRAIASTRGGQAVYSTDGGATWNVAGGIGANGRVQVAYARKNPAIVYASVDDNKGELWKSADGGQSYSQVNSGTRFLGDQGWIHNAIWIDPTNENTLVLGGLDLWRSTDGGRTLTKISKWQKAPDNSSHGDQKVIVNSTTFNGSLFSMNNVLRHHN